MDYSHLIDENNSGWMENTVLIENQDITWQEDGPEITVDYSEPTNDINKTLSESDGYLTANNESSGVETSQYFSILESNCDEDEFGEPEDKTCVVKVDLDKAESILPDITKDEAGEQYKEAEGNLEDAVVGENADDHVILYRMEGSDDLFAVQLADDGNGNFQKYKYRVRQNEEGQLEAVPGSIEIQKADQNDILLQSENSELLEDGQILENSPSKDEKPSPATLSLINQQIDENSDTEIDGNFYNVGNFEDINPEDYLIQNSYQDDEDEYQTVEGVHVTADSEDADESADDAEIDRTGNIQQPEEPNSESEYEIEELEDAFQDRFEEGEVASVGNTQILQKSNIDNTKLKSESENRNLTIFKDDKHLSYLVINAKEKENVVVRPNNLRSILKSNWSNNKMKVLPKLEKEKPKIPAIIANSKLPKESLPVHNIAPKPRQPRKQTIKPLERADSEILVIPLVYSIADNSFKISEPAKKKPINEEDSYVVSDESDPEFTLKPQKKKIKRMKNGKRGRPKNVEITILDSDEEDEMSEESVIEVSDKDDESDNNNEQLVAEDNSEIIKEETPAKIEKSGEETTEIAPKQDSEKSPQDSPSKRILNKNKKCPHCPKTFPRLINLKKHLIIHSTRRSLRSKNSETNENRSDIKIDPPKFVKYNCPKCKLNFLTEMQYKRHQTIHIAKRKERLSPVKKPDKKILINQKYLRSQTKPNLKPVRTVVEKAKEIFKCEYCSQHFGTRTLLIVHRNAHKTFSCPNCKTTFTAKLLLDDHLRKNCVKMSPNKTRPVGKFSPKKINSKCEICNQIFPTTRSLLIHKTVSHKPSRNIDKPLINPKPSKSAHGGVPPSLKLQQALSKLNKVKS